MNLVAKNKVVDQPEFYTCPWKNMGDTNPSEKSISLADSRSLSITSWLKIKLS